MKGTGRDLVLILGASVVLTILMSNPTGTGNIIKQLGGTSASLIAALQARDTPGGIGAQS